MSDIDFHVMLNASSGTALAAGVTADALEAKFAALGHRVTIDADSSQPFERRLRAARNSPAPVLVAAGGDGTVTALAGAASQSGKRLAILPLGTANLLARDLGLPLDIDQWFAELGRMEERDIDFGEVNGRIFLHKVVIGAVPGIAVVREKIRGNGTLGAQLGFLTHFFRSLSRVRRFAVAVTPETGEPVIHRVHAIAVANNDYAAGLGKVFARSRLDAGLLSLYFVRSLSPGDALRLGLEMLLGTWRNDEAIEIEAVRAVTVRTRRRRVRAMIDGEVEMIDGPFEFCIHPRGLKVLAGPVATETSEAAPLEATG